MMLLLVILLMPPPPQMMTHILYLLYCLAVVDTVIDVATDDVRVSQLRLSPPRQPQTRLKISPGHQNIHDVVIVVKVVVSSSPWSYSTKIWSFCLLCLLLTLWKCLFRILLCHIHVLRVFVNLDYGPCLST